MTWIEREVARVEDSVYGGSMPVANKSVLRKMLQKDEKIWEKQLADYSEADAGEAPKGAQW